ncbi:kinase-like domain-containing protein [Rhizophagus clarus]|uniref:Kinase-like domain-containing protein n=1 Tax=Rhizophagus clarus TaxID=94130 RepID=A0A8H3QNS6_9GLOM|nr:kinase-like domain-containing protein [Rhizophagus clarus]
MRLYQKQKEIFNILNNWWINFDDQAELRKQIKEAGEINNSLTIPSTSLAIYTSRLFNFNNLPKPKNSIDYYDEQNDNIISRRFTESLQIDIFQLEISDVDETKSLQIDNIINKEFSESFQIDISQLEISDAGNQDYGRNGIRKEIMWSNISALESSSNMKEELRCSAIKLVGSQSMALLYNDLTYSTNYFVKTSHNQRVFLTRRWDSQSTN